MDERSGARFRKDLIHFYVQICMYGESLLKMPDLRRTINQVKLCESCVSKDTIATLARRKKSLKETQQSLG